MSLSRQEKIMQTYFGLRLAMVVLTFMLLASIVIQLVNLGCMQSSISAYYFTPVRPIFIATLCVVGTGLIIYRGNTPFENGVLDIAGFLAIIVALVPTKESGMGCKVTNAPSTEEILSIVANNIGALFLAGLVALLSSLLLKPRYAKKGKLAESSRFWSFSVSTALLAAGALYFLNNPAGFATSAHLRAALLFFVLILVVIGANAPYAKSPYNYLYWLILGGTLLIGVPLFILGVTGHGFTTWLFWVESVCILGFAAFWTVQTKELGGFVDRKHKVEAQNADSPAIEPSNVKLHLP